MMLRLDLQFFAGEKTEKATPKKRQDSRKKGQVLKSQDVTSAIVLLICVPFPVFCCRIHEGPLFYVFHTCIYGICATHHIWMMDQAMLIYSEVINSNGIYFITDHAHRSCCRHGRKFISIRFAFYSRTTEIRFEEN